MARVGFFLAGFGGDARDYFPFPIPGDYTVPNPAASYLCPFNEAFAFVYRYRFLKFDYDVTMDDGFGNLFHTSGSLTTNNIPVQPANELHIGEQPYIRQFSTTDDGAGNGATVDVMLNNWLGGNSADTQWEMYLDVAVQTGAGTMTTNPISGSATLILSILGHNVQMYGGGPGGTTGSVSVSVDEWWEYDDGTGPIWDHTDGHELITPVPTNFSS
jgi:hypothetical protein